jgi:hypothetical protein
MPDLYMTENLLLVRETFFAVVNFFNKMPGRVISGCLLRDSFGSC